MPGTRALSLMVGSRVLGGYNQSTSLMGDLFRCLTGKMRLSGIQSQDAGGQTDWCKTTETLFQLERARRAPAC